jgi:hypothetical protein
MFDLGSRSTKQPPAALALNTQMETSHTGILFSQGQNQFYSPTVDLIRLMTIFKEKEETR